MDNLDASLSPRKTPANRAMMAGLYIAAASIALGLISYVTGFSEAMITNKSLNWLNTLVSLAITFAIIHMAVRMYRDRDNGGYLTVSNALGLGTLAGLISGVIVAVWTFIFMSFIAPDMMDMIKRTSMEQMQQGGQSEEQVEQAMDMMSFFFSPVFIAGSVAIGSIFIGFLCGLVSGLIQKRDRPTYV